MTAVPTTSWVAVSAGHNGYPSAPPYSPATAFPEYPFYPHALTDSINPAYDGVRSALHLLGLDAEHFGQKDWNPLGGIIKPGNTVVLKPNFIRHFRETQEGHDDCLITHGAVIRAAADYVYIALGGRGRLIIADAVQNDADFAVIRRMAGLDEIQEFYCQSAGFNVEVLDLRPERAEKINGVVVDHQPLPGDPAGYVKVNLGPHSAFVEVNRLCHLLYGSEYDTREVRSHHHDHIHEYLVSKTVLGADCVINLPKLKTHKKTGITVCMKNLVGINGNKNWLPHHREGTPSQGGDQFADDGYVHRVERAVVAGFKRVFPMLGPLKAWIASPSKAVGQRLFGSTATDTIRSGNWYGNDTTWRMVVDLNRLFLYADAEGNLHDQPVRRVLNIVDGIIGGEGNGPLDPTPKPAGVVLGGESAVAVDLACARLMDLDYQRIPTISRALGCRGLPLSPCGPTGVVVRSNAERFQGTVADIAGPAFAFKPHFGWRGHVELSGHNDGHSAPQAARETESR
jgi:uncharacterized protein (DUF362 family)